MSKKNPQIASENMKMNFSKGWGIILYQALMFFFPMMMGSFAFSLAGAAIIAFGAIAVVSCFWSLRVASAMREAERRARSDIGRFDEV